MGTVISRQAHSFQDCCKVNALSLPGCSYLQWDYALLWPPVRSALNSRSYHPIINCWADKLLYISAIPRFSLSSPSSLFRAFLSPELWVMAQKVASLNRERFLGKQTGRHYIKFLLVIFSKLLLNTWIGSHFTADGVYQSRKMYIRVSVHREERDDSPHWFSCYFPPSVFSSSPFNFLFGSPFLFHWETVASLNRCSTDQAVKLWGRGFVYGSCIGYCLFLASCWAFNSCTMGQKWNRYYLPECCIFMLQNQIICQISIVQLLRHRSPARKT